MDPRVHSLTVSCKIIFRTTKTKTKKKGQRMGEKMRHRCPFRFAANCFLGIYYYFYLDRMFTASVVVAFQPTAGHCGRTATSEHCNLTHTPVIKIKL